MIKEISFKATQKNEYVYPSVSIDTEMEQPFKLKIDLLKEAHYFKEKLESKKVNIEQKVIKGDWVPVSRWTSLVCVSKKFKDIFEGKLKGTWHPTNHEEYFIFVLDNCIDILDKDKTVIVNNKEKPYWYESISNETFKEEVSQEYLFTLEVEPLRKLCTPQFEKLVKEHNLKGIQFYKNINFKRDDGSRFDGLRMKEYDDEGNCLN